MASSVKVLSTGSRTAGLVTDQVLEVKTSRAKEFEITAKEQSVGNRRVNVENLGARSTGRTAYHVTIVNYDASRGVSVADAWNAIDSFH